MRLNLGCSDQFLDGFIGVDKWTPPWATDSNFIKADLSLSWPFADNSIEYVRAHDVIEHLPQKIVTMNEIYRVLKPGGTVEIVVPTTDGRGAWQDPTHVSFWNRNSFFYFENGNPHNTRFREAYGIKCEFRIVGERQERIADDVVKLAITLEAVKLSEAAFTFLQEPYGVAARTYSPTMIDGLEAMHIQSAKGKRPAFSILHTSARPDKWREIYDAWLGSAFRPEDVEYVVCFDERWGFKKGFDGSALRPQDKVIWNTGRRCYVDGVNLAAEASTGDVLIVNADDQHPCDKWDMRLSDAITTAREEWKSEGFVIEVNTQTPDEHGKKILVMPVLSRERYERFGWIFFPGYESMWADNDFCAMAKRDGCIIDARHLVFPHKHWTNGQRAIDEPDKAHGNRAVYDAGEKLFSARKTINFAGVPPAEAKPVQTKPMVAVLTPGNIFSMAWVDAWTRLWQHVISNYSATHVMAYTSNAGMVRTMMARHILNTDFGAPVDYVLWIDDDNTLTPEQFDMLMAGLNEHPEFDAIAGWTWCGGDDSPEVGTATTSCGEVRGLELTEDGQDVKFCHIKQLSPRQIKESTTDLIEIGYSGFPAVLMRKSLLEKAGKKLFTPFVDDDRCEFGFSGEDLAFFARATVRTGARYAVDRRVHVPHYKRRAIAPIPTQQQAEQATREMALK